MEPQNQHETLDEIDQRQDEILQQLDELNEQIEGVLRQFQSERAAAMATQEPESEADPGADREEQQAA